MKPIAIEFLHVSGIRDLKSRNHAEQKNFGAVTRTGRLASMTLGKVENWCGGESFLLAENGKPMIILAASENDFLERRKILPHIDRRLKRM